MEDWLGKVEEAMIVNLRKLARLALADFFSPTREEWSVSYPSQVIIQYTLSCFALSTTLFVIRKKNN